MRAATPLAGRLRRPARLVIDPTHHLNRVHGSMPPSELDVGEADAQVRVEGGPQTAAGGFVAGGAAGGVPRMPGPRPGDMRCRYQRLYQSCSHGRLPQPRAAPGKGRGGRALHPGWPARRLPLPPSRAPPLPRRPSMRRQCRALCAMAWSSLCRLWSPPRRSWSSRWGGACKACLPRGLAASRHPGQPPAGGPCAMTPVPQLTI